jgi:hypothetical protein
LIASSSPQAEKLEKGDRPNWLGHTPFQQRMLVRTVLNNCGNCALNAFSAYRH